MEQIIGDIVDRFERGRLSRRELIQGLSMLGAAASSAAAEPEQPAPVSASGIDHVSVLVSDLDRSQDFYRKVFGMSLLSEDKEHGIRRLGGKRVIVSLRKETPYGTVDHFGIHVENFDRDRATQTLARHGLTPRQNWQYGYYVNDPDGMNVQLL